MTMAATMKYTAEEEIAAYRSAQSDGDREYWTRQIIIRRIRKHRARNQVVLRNEKIWFAKLTGVAIAGGGVGLLAVTKFLS